METTYPVRDLTAVQQRNLIGNRATVSVYDTSESKEPAITITGKVLGLAINSTITLILLEGVTNPTPIEADKPVTITVDGEL